MDQPLARHKRHCSLHGCRARLAAGRAVLGITAARFLWPQTVQYKTEAAVTTLALVLWMVNTISWRPGKAYQVVVEIASGAR